MLARLFSVVAHQMVGLAVGWMVYERTRDPLALGLVGLAQIVPVVGLALWAGSLADRVDRRRILVLCQALGAALVAAMAGVARAGGTSVLPVYAVLFGLGCARAFLGPSMQAILPSLVPLPAFSNAVGWRTLLFESCSVVGPLLAGCLIGPAGLEGTFLTASVLMGVSAMVMAGLPRARPAPVPEEGVRRDLWEGLRHVWGRPAILGALTLDLFAVLFGGATALLPIFAKDILHVGPQGLGALSAAPSVGAILAMLVMLRFPPCARAGAVLLTAVSCYGAAMLGFGLSIWFPLSLGLLALGGMADGVSVLIRHTLLQTMTPDALRGRVSAVNGIFFNASNELGELESGVAAKLVGAGPSVVLGGALTLGTVALIAWRFPALRKLDRLAAEGDGDGVPASRLTDPETEAA